VKPHALDETDIDILRILFNDCRTSYRSIGHSVELSTNAVKARIKRLFSTGVIQDFSTMINPAAFGDPKLCHLTIKDSKTLKETMNRLKLLGEPVMKLYCIGGISVIVVAIRKQEQEKIQLLSETLKPAIVQNCFVGQSPPTTQKLRETDFKILKCLISNPKMEISEIARRISVSSKTVSSRLEKMKENKMLHFIVKTGPASMQGYVRFIMIIRMERKGSQKSIRQIQEELEKNFVIAFPIIIQEDVETWQLVAQNIFEIDPVLKKIELLGGVRGADVYIPFRTELYMDWMLREIDSNVSVA
jgi:Lrp/AsnC family transcriptional regulator for asnA, asnC and gidA